MNKNPHAVALGKISAKVGNRKGNSNFGRELANKRWSKVKSEANRTGSDLLQTPS